MDDDAPPPPPVSPVAPSERLCTRLLLKTFWDTIDHFAFLAMANAACLLLCLTVVGAPWGVGGLLECAALAATGREPDWPAFRRGARTRWPLALAALVGALGAALSLAAGIAAYPAMLGPTGYFVAGAHLWLCLGALALMAYTVGARMIRGLPIPEALRLAATLIVLHPWYTLFVLLWAFLWLALCAFLFPLAVPFALFAGAAVGTMAAFIVPMRAHWLAPAASPDPATPADRPRSWAEVRARREATARQRADAFLERDELTRSWRELFRPWES